MRPVGILEERALPVNPHIRADLSGLLGGAQHAALIGIGIAGLAYALFKACVAQPRLGGCGGLEGDDHPGYSFVPESAGRVQ